MNSGKRGLSPIIATVLIVLLTVAGVAVLVGIVVPFVRDNLNKSTECSNFQGYFEFVEDFDYGGKNYNFNCFSGSRYGISLEATSAKSVDEKELLGFHLGFFGEGISEGVEPNELIMLNGSLEIDLPERGEIRTYIYPSIEEYNRMEVYPVLSNGKVCEKSDDIEIISCDGGILNG